MFRTTFVISGLFLLSLFGSCKKDEDNGGVPYVEVNYALRLTDPEFIKLTTVGNWEYITGGSRGILIYRVSSEEFVAFDRHCPYDPTEVCSQLDVDATNVRVNDYDCCGSVYSIVNGSVLNGPSTRPMKQYNTSFDGTTLIITN